MTRIPTYCALCISRCGCLATVEDGRLLRIESDPAHPTGRAICVKARAAPELVDHPRRLTTPLVRTRPKGTADPDWRAIGWEEALDLAAARLRALAEREGPEAVAFAVTTPSGTAIADSFAWIHRLAHAFGSPNLVFATENCNWHKDFTPELTWGAGIGMPDYARTRLILHWGFNPAVTWLAHADVARQAQRRGARLVVIDPRRAGLASQADLWLAPRPGTDGALALGLAHGLFENGGLDTEFLRGHSDAFSPIDGDDGQTVLDALRARCAEYPPERVAAITGIPADKIARLADWLAREKPVSFFTWTGTAQQSNATQTSRAIHVLYALTGCLDTPGGNAWFAKPPIRDVSGFEWVDADTRARTLGRAERPAGPGRKGWITSRDLFAAIVEETPYPVRGLVSFGGNFQLTKPATRHARAAMQRLDFCVMTELFMTPSCQEADLILPVASCWEREGLQPGFMVSAAAERRIQLRPAVVPPRGESRPDTDIVFALATRLGLGDRFFGGDVEAGLRHQLEPLGLTPDALRAAPRGIDLDLPDAWRKYERTGFATPSGRLELYSIRLAAIGVEPLPAYQPASMAPETQATLAASYPLRLTCAKCTQYCHSQQRQLPSLRRSMSEPLAELHPDTAAARGIGHGDAIDIRTPDGHFQAHARLSAKLRPDTVRAQYGWWHPEMPLSYNDAIDGEHFDPVSGSNALRAYLCEVSPIRPDTV